MAASKSEITATLDNFHTNLWSHFISIPKEVGDQFVEGDNRRVLCSINGAPSIQCALMPREDTYFVLINNQTRKKLGLEEGDQLKLTIEKDNSEYGHQVPESFQALLAQDDEGRAHFENLTKGKQRSLVYIVSKVKNMDSQLAKGLAIMHHLKEANGELDFKRLNVLIKEYNNRK